MTFTHLNPRDYDSFIEPKTKQGFNFEVSPTMKYLYIELGVSKLTPKVPRPFLAQEPLETVILIARCKTFKILIFLAYITIGSCTRLVLKYVVEISKSFDSVDCKIFAFKVKKTFFFAHSMTRFFGFESS